VPREYDLHLGALHYRKTFTDYLQEIGETMRSSNPAYVVQTNLDESTAVFFFDRSMPVGVTIAFRKQQDEWRIAYLSFNEIDPKSIVFR